MIAGVQISPAIMIASPVMMIAGVYALRIYTQQVRELHSTLCHSYHNSKINPVELKELTPLV